MEALNLDDFKVDYNHEAKQVIKFLEKLNKCIPKAHFSVSYEEKYTALDMRWVFTYKKKNYTICRRITKEQLYVYDIDMIEQIAHDVFVEYQLMKK